MPRNHPDAVGALNACDLLDALAVTPDLAEAARIIRASIESNLDPPAPTPTEK